MANNCLANCEQLASQKFYQMGLPLTKFNIFLNFQCYSLL